MNSYTLHITLYDLFFFGMIFIGLNFAVLLAFVKSINRSANRLLALALVSMILWMMRILAMDIRLEIYLPGWDLVPMQFLLALGPLMYFYVLKITRPEYKFSRKDFLHFMPVLLEQVVPLNQVVQLLIFISVIIYLYRSHHLIQNFYRRLQPVLMDRSLLEFRWLRRLLAATALLWLLWIAYAVVDYFGYRNQLGIHGYYPFYIFFTVILIWTAMAAFLNPQAPAFRPLRPAEPRGKGEWLKKAMEAGRYHRDPELNLSSLAVKLGLTTHELSRIMNTALKKSFHDFINEYRVAEVIKRMHDPACDHITLLGIAYDSGFNSKATFNRIFKQMTGVSPIAYKNQPKKEVSSYNLRRNARFADLISNHATIPGWQNKKLTRNYMIMIKHNFKVAWRNLIKDGQFSLLNLIGLSTGLACSLLIYLWVSDELSIDKFNTNDQRIYQVMVNMKTDDGIKTSAHTPGLLAQAIADQIPEVEKTVSVLPASWFSSKGVITAGENKIKAGGQYVGRNFFDVFTIRFVEGGKNQLFAGINNIAISRELAIKLFGTTQNLIGTPLKWDQSEFGGSFAISGIFEKTPANASDQYDVLLNYDLVLQRRPNLLQWANSDPNTYILVKNNANLTAINTKINQVIASKLKETGRSQFLVKASDQYLYGNYENGIQTGGRISYVKLFSMIAIVILIIACINFMNLSTAKAARRMKEVGIKKVSGASRLELVIQYLSESLLMAFLALLLAIILILLLLPLFNSITGKQLSIHFDTGLIASVLGITILTGIIAGSYPAFYLSGFNPVAVLKGKLRSNAGEVFIRKGLVIFQFTASVVFIATVLIVHRQINYIQSRDLGYNRNQLMHFEIPLGSDTNKINSAKAFISEVKNLPGVAQVSSYYHNLTGKHGTVSGFQWAGKEPAKDIQFANLQVGSNFLETTGIKIKEGRSFSINDNAKNEVIFNESAIKEMGLKNPVGQTVMIFGQPRKVVGVARDFNFESLYSTVKPAVIQVEPVMSNVLVSIKSGTEKQTIEQIRSLYTGFNKGVEFDYKFVDDDYQALYVSEMRIGTLSTYFAALAIIISCLGLFGLAAFTAQKRQKEIGIRKVIGASVGNVVFMLSKDFIKLIALSLLVATPVGYYLMHQWLSGFAYRTNLPWWLFVVIAASVIAIALATISFQALKAALANPVKSLKVD